MSAIDDDLADFGESFSMRRPDGVRISLVRSEIARAATARAEQAERDRDIAREHRDGWMARAERAEDAIREIGDLVYRFGAFDDRHEVIDLCGEIHRRAVAALDSTDPVEDGPEEQREGFGRCTGCGDDIWPGEAYGVSASGDTCAICLAKSAQRPEERSDEGPKTVGEAVGDAIRKAMPSAQRGAAPPSPKRSR